ncbi:recombination regulator RecX [Aestuariirhabdus sp. Z084]|uniref:regulatory protein RecX n=1 Tax=Aestuariirhabdus haliotis TaxID=2918751 RepID=UPI00201B402D|nr:regulatory protein RecX [Aestuariirhabdus haliotis]MCL6416339.1 recombination regulator RecX [Aestuariirhabdus haliotis]MCL6420328.1 recombination regulator RecX [Aestuariirhabdus haliotis]
MSEKSEIRRAAMNLLARREHSQQELREKLQRRFPPELIEIEIELLAEQKLQSDQRFVDSFVRSRLSRYQGPSRIRAELKQKGIEEHLFEQTLFENPVDWYALLGELNQRKFGGQPAQNPAEKARRLRFFQYRGFSFEQINEVIN